MKPDLMSEPMREMYRDNLRKTFETVTTESLVAELLNRLGEDHTREGLQETPARYVKAMKFWMSGYGENPAKVLKTFEDGARGCDQLVVQRNIPVWSLCEHHLCPFFGRAHLAYIPNQRIVGLSKLARVVEVFSRRLQVQERLTNQIADALHDNLGPKGVGVVLECRHLCIESRGIQKAGTVTVTSALRGALLDEPETRAEFLSFTQNHPWEG